MGRIGLLVATALIAGGVGTQPVYAQSGTGSQKSEKADKQKSTEKKNAAKQSGTQTQPSPAPMSGYRPDSLSNY